MPALTPSCWATDPATEIAGDNHLAALMLGSGFQSHLRQTLAALPPRHLRDPAAFLPAASPQSEEALRRTSYVSQALWSSPTPDLWRLFWNVFIAVLQDVVDGCPADGSGAWCLWFHLRLHESVETLNPKYDEGLRDGGRIHARAAVLDLLQQGASWSRQQWTSELLRMIQGYAPTIVASLHEVDTPALSPPSGDPGYVVDDLINALDGVWRSCDTLGVSEPLRLRIFWPLYRQIAECRDDLLEAPQPLPPAILLQLELDRCRLEAWWADFVMSSLPVRLRTISPLLLLEDATRMCQQVADNTETHERSAQARRLSQSVREFECQWHLDCWEDPRPTRRSAPPEHWPGPAAGAGAPRSGVEPASMGAAAECEQERSQGSPTPIAQTVRQTLRQGSGLDLGMFLAGSVAERVAEVTS